MADFVNIFNQGGWTMYPLAACSLIALTIILERGFALRRTQVIDPRVSEIIESYDGEASADRLLYACQRVPGAFARIIEQVIRVRHLDHAQCIETMHAVGRRQVGVLERGLTVLEIIGGVSPFLGLLGTVLGMMAMFNALTSQGMGDPKVLSGGIAEALITTVTGLFIAIPAVAFHSLYSKRIEDYAVEMQERATSFIVKLQSLR